MIVVKNLTKSMGKNVVLDNISFVVENGGAFGLIGANGSGKTLLLNALAGMVSIDGGSVEINRQPMTKSGGSRPQIGFMPEEFGIYDNITVLEYMNFFSGAYRIPFAKRLENINNLLELVGLMDQKGRYLQALSRGMKQRLCLARSLINDPSVLLLDEPGAGMDASARNELKEILKQLKAWGKTIIVSSNNLQDMAEIASEIGIMNGGKMIARGSVADVLRVLGKERIFYLRPEEVSEGLLNILREHPRVGRIMEKVDCVEFVFDGDAGEQSELLRVIVAKEHRVLEYREKENTLESIFLQLAEGGILGA